MCGIVYKHNFDGSPANNAVLDQYDKQHHRGTKGFGVFDGEHMKIAHETQEKNILKWFVKHNSSLIMFHHRFPTSTINVAKAAHPISTQKYFGDTQYVMVHNGIIRNSDKLFVDHSSLGINYGTLLDDLTFNDSESLLWDFALTMEGKQKEMKAAGDMAFICMKIVKGKLKQMLFGRNTRPLQLFKTKDTIELSSEGRGVAIPSGILHMWDYKSKKLRLQEMEFPAYEAWAGKTVGGSGNVGTFPSREEYDSYDEYLDAKYKGKDREANWQRLRRKYGAQNYLPANIPNDMGQVSEEALYTAPPLSEPTLVADILEAKKDSSGKFLVETKHRDAIDVDKLNLKDYEPTSGEVQNLAMQYMINAKGIFDEAYAALEDTYCNLLGVNKHHETFDDIRLQLLYEAAMEFINSDPEYENEHSTSSMWRSLWAQQKLTV